MGELLTLTALALAWGAARVTLRRRAVFLLGRHGHRLAPAVLLSVWLSGLMLGQATHSVVGMSFVAATPLLALAWVSARRFPVLHARHRRWSTIDAAAFIYAGLTVFFIDLWDVHCHSAVVGHLLRGNVPPTALNDPRFPLSYHSTYDAVVALVMTALPVKLEVGLDLVTIGCIAITLTNLQAVSRLLFRSPLIAQLGRLLFLFGFGPVFIRYFLEPRDVETLHGRTSQVFVDIMLRRPTSLGFALFTLALGLLLSLYPRGAQPAPAARPRSLIFLLPTCALLPMLSEEATLMTGVLTLSLLVTGRIPWRWAAAAALAVAVGATQSGVVRGLLGQASMATPHLRWSWPPTLPAWNRSQEGVPVVSLGGLLVLLVEFGPVFFAAIGLALASREPRRRVLLLPFVVALLLVSFARMDNWPKADLDRFLFYTTPTVFMLGAAIVERLCRSDGPGTETTRTRSVVLSIGLALFACVPAMIWATSMALRELGETYRSHALGGDVRRNLSAVGAREPIVTDLANGNRLVQSGFLVVAPMTGSSVGQISGDHFDEYVRGHLELARWFFLPENDDRVKGQPVVAREGDHVLVRAPRPTAAPMR